MPAATLLSAPIELAGNWGEMLPGSVARVLARMRSACLDGTRLVSDRQPTRLRVDEHHSGPPAVWLHPDGSSIAWVIVNVGERAWSQLAYQFGHELGHVFANSWQPAAIPAAPCQWVEEALVEAFSLRGLGRLAQSWEQDPPFAGDSHYGALIGRYRQDIMARYESLALAQGGLDDLGAWFARHRAGIESGGGLNPFAQAASLTILAEYDAAPECFEGVGCLNRWPGRSGLPIGEYLQMWERSCIELRASPRLPVTLRSRLRLA